MKKFNVKPLGAIISGLAMAAVSQSMMAQTTDVNENEPEVEEIVVTGFARSIQNAIDVKRNADTVVQAISADDIGGLPDVSIADALGRVPGITVTREGGQAGRIQVRGMGGGFVLSTLNGREQVSPNGTRAMEYSQFPSELINSVQVYMSPKASLIEGGVSGTVELKTANPLEMTEDQKFTVAAKGSYNDQAPDIYGAEPYGTRFSVSLQKKLLDDTLGVSLGYAQLKQAKSTLRFEHYGYEGVDLEDSTVVVDKNFKALDDYYEEDFRPEEIGMSTGFEIFQTGGEDTRDGYVAALQFTPNESFSAQADVFYSKFDSTGFSRGYRVSNFKGANAASVILGANDTVIGGDFRTDDEVPASFDLQMNFTDKAPTTELLAGGVNLDWTFGDLSFSVDLSHSDASGFNDDKNVEMHKYTSTVLDDRVVYSRDPNQSVTYLTDGINVPSITIGNIPEDDAGWYDSEGVSPWRITKYGHYPYINDDVMDAIKFDLKYELEMPLISSVEAGARYSERNHKQSRKVFIYGADSGYNDDPLIGQVGDKSLAITSDRSDVVNWGGDFSNMPDFLAVDADGILRDAWEAKQVLGNMPLPTTGTPNPEQPRRSLEPAADWNHPWTIQQRADIDENVTSFYLQANLATTLMGKDLVGNVGFRHVISDQSSLALINVNGNTDAGAVIIYDDLGVPNAEYAYDRQGKKYSDNLPSLNLNYSLTDEDQLRLAVARVLSRAPIEDLAASTNLGNVNIEGVVPVYSYGSGTSPFLTPFIADQIDISYEHYMEDTNGTFSVAAYHREIKSFIQKITEEQYDFRGNGFDVPDMWEVEIEDDVFEDRPVENGDYSTAINNKEGGYMRGLEITYTQTFNFLPDYLSGLGFSGSASFTDSEITTPFRGRVSTVNPTETPFPGLVERSSNFTVFYSYENFETRLSTTFQDSFVGEVRNIDLNTVYFAPETVMDYQASYKFDIGVDVVFSVNNLTNEPNRSYGGDEQFTRLLQWFGRTYYAGVNYTF